MFENWKPGGSQKKYAGGIWKYEKEYKILRYRPESVLQAVPGAGKGAPGGVGE